LKNVHSIIKDTQFQRMSVYNIWYTKYFLKKLDCTADNSRRRLRLHKWYVFTYLLTKG